MRQPTSNLPADIPPPRYLLGQKVWMDKESIGRIVGMVYISRDAALAMQLSPGWEYTIETPAFEYNEPHHQQKESDISPLVETL